MPKFKVTREGKQFTVEAPNIDAVEERVNIALKQNPDIGTPISTTGLPISRELVPGGGGVLIQEPRSPLTGFERLKLSFFDKPGTRQFLQRRFPGEQIRQSKETGKFSVGGREIDPRFVRGTLKQKSEEVLGDIADVVGETPIVAGSTIGFLLGGPPGAAIGGGGGQAVRSLVGQALGGRGGDITSNLEVAEQIKSEALQILGTAGTEFLFSFGIEGIKRLIAGSSKKFIETPVRRVLSALTDIPEANFKRVQARGAEKVLSAENLKPNALLNIGRKIKVQMRKLANVFGRNVGIAKEQLKKNNPLINIDDTIQSFKGELQGLGLLDIKGNIIDIPASQKSIAKRKLIQLWKDLGTKQNIKIKDAFLFRDSLENFIKRGQTQKLSIGTNEQRILSNLRSNLASGINKSSDALAIANKNNAVFRTELDNANRLFGGFDDVTIENRLRTLLVEQDRGRTAKLEALESLDNFLPANERFSDELFDKIAASSFISETAAQKGGFFRAGVSSLITPAATERGLRRTRGLSRFGQALGRRAEPLIRADIRRRAAQAAQRSLREPTEIQAQPIIRQPQR